MLRKNKTTALILYAGQKNLSERGVESLDTRLSYGERYSLQVVGEAGGWVNSTLLCTVRIFSIS